jgi:cell wall-associated NlpC family hydrolase
MPHIEDVLLWAIAQKGDKYVFGVEVSAAAADAINWDCSELVEWSCAKAGVTPRVLDGAFNQWAQCKKARSLISIKDGMATRGALLFVGDGIGTGRDAITHVAFSLGDGTTVEARGAKWGVGCWRSARRFDFAATIPGVDYGFAGAAKPPLREDIDMAHIVKRAGDGTGKVYLIDAGRRVWLDTPDAVEKAVAALGPTVRFAAKDEAGNVHALEWDTAIVDLYPPMRPDLDM